MLLIDYLLEHGIAELHEKFAIKVKPHEKYNNLILLKYDQIDSPKNPVTRQCRGIILDRDQNYKIIARPYDRFANYGESWADTIDWSSAKVYEKLDGCFHRDTRLQLWNGGTITIGEIVNKNANPVLIGLSENGEPIPCTVTSRFKNGTKNNWIDIVFDEDINVHGTLLSNKLRVTTNHEIYSQGNYKLAGQLKIGDKVTTMFQSPCDNTVHYIESSLLGDGSLIWNTPGVKYQESHKVNHCDLILLSEQSLGQSYLSTRDIISGFGTNMKQVTSKSFSSLVSLREKWYPNGKKCVPKDLSWMSTFSFAKWYIDDGSLSHNSSQKDRACFATNGFIEQDVRRLSEKLESTFNVKTNVYFSKGWCIRINSGNDNSIDNFWSAIAPYIPLQLRYKLPEKFRNVLYIPWENNCKIIYRTKEVTIKNIQTVPNTKKEFPSGRCGYDIETTSHNYLAQGIVVHNSLCTLYYYNDEWHVSSSGDPAASGQVNGFDFTFKELFWRVWKQLGYELPEETNKCYMFELCTIYNKVLVHHKEPRIVLHGVRNLHTQQEFGPQYHALHNGWECVKTFNLTSLDAAVETCKSIDPSQGEGFVVVDKNFNRVKIKSPAYVSLSHLKESINPKSMLEIIRTNESSEFLNYFPEYESYYYKLKKSYDSLVKDIEQTYESYKYIQDRKEFALQVKDKPFSGILFSLKQGKSDSVKSALQGYRVEKLVEMLPKEDIHGS